MKSAWRHRVSSGNQFCYCDSTSTTNDDVGVAAVRAEIGTIPRCCALGAAHPVRRAITRGWPLSRQQVHQERLGKARTAPVPHHRLARHQDRVHGPAACTGQQRCSRIAHRKARVVPLEAVQHEVGPGTGHHTARVGVEPEHLAPRRGSRRTGSATCGPPGWWCRCAGWMNRAVISCKMIFRPSRFSWWAAPMWRECAWLWITCATGFAVTSATAADSCSPRAGGASTRTTPFLATRNIALTVTSSARHGSLPQGAMPRLGRSGVRMTGRRGCRRTYGRPPRSASRAGR